MASVLIFILIGALAAGLGVAFFLKKANDDREHLTAVVEEAQETSKTAVETSKKTIEEANVKLEAANNEIAKAQSVIKALQDERDLATQAKQLTAPTSRVLKNWKEALNLSLGISVKYPPTQRVETNDASALTLAKPTTTAMTDFQTDARWFSITPYDVRLERELIESFSSSTSVSYVVQGHLLTGIHGTLASGVGDVYVLHVQQNGVNSHLIWAKNPGSKNDQTLETVFSTLSFAR